MFSTTTRQAADVEIGRRHPYLVKFGGPLAATLLVGVVLAGVGWLAVRAAGSLGAPGLPSLALPDVSLPGGSWVVVGVVVLALLALWRLVAFLRSPFRMGWRYIR